MERKFSRGWHTVLGSWEWDTIFKKTHVIESHKKQHNTAPPIECIHYRLPLDELANLRFRAQLTWMGIKSNCAAPPDFLNCIWTNGSSYDAGLWQSKKKKMHPVFYRRLSHNVSLWEKLLYLHGLATMKTGFKAGRFSWRLISCSVSLMYWHCESAFHLNEQ